MRVEITAGIALRLAQVTSLVHEKIDLLVWWSTNYVATIRTARGHPEDGFIDPNIKPMNCRRAPNDGRMRTYKKIRHFGRRVTLQFSNGLGTIRVSGETLVIL